jgi:glucuronoarabinoxylan endo-1,4-beta-xylanase
VSELTKSRWGRLSILLAIGCGLACDPKASPQTIDSQTNWLKSCQIDSQCGDSKCLCGVCTSPCAEDAACADRDGASCVSAKEPGAIAQCGGTRPPTAGLCMPRCDDAPCADKKQMCVAGVCTPVPAPTAEVVVDTQSLHQMLVGFGATVAYGEDEITTHPQGTALYDTLFADLGLDILRVRDRFEHAGDDNLTITRQLIDAATTSLGHKPTLFMTSWSPPPALKANASVQCSGNADTCTLTRTAAGDFDYAGFASFIRRSLDAYAALGVVPDYFGIQNNPNWVPTAAELGEACRFLPTEGTVTVPVRGVSTRVEYPGFDRAQTATVQALSGLAALPRILAPETSDFASMADYVPTLDFSEVEALSHHLYGVDPEMIDTDALAAIGALAADNSRPVFQTEMQSDGFGTTLFLHYTTVVEGAAAYVQQTLTGSASGPNENPQTLVGLDTNSFTRQDPYYAFQHYALHTDPGWMRADATSSADGLLASAWLSPIGNELTVVLVNAGTTDIDAKLSLANGGFTTSAVTRTVFGASEHAAELGSLSSAGILTLPPRAVVTIWFTP